MRSALVTLLLCACATTAPAPAPTPAQKPAPSEAELLAPKLAALEQHAAAFEATRDDAVWAFWLGNPAAATTDPWAGHELLLDDAALSTIRRARALKSHDARALDRLEELIAGERVGRAMREAETALANLEASLRFTFEGREVLFRELGGLLASEKSPQRRQSLWAASLTAAKQLDAALARRDEAQAEALKAIDHTPESFAALLRAGALEQQPAWADRFLLATDLRWKARLAAQHVGSRGDLPFLLKPSTSLDAAFPKGRIAERGTALLASLGLYGLPNLTLELTDAPRKQPLPLTVSGVRLSFKPRGGWKDQQALLAELGRALALRHAPLAARRTVETTAALFASLAWNRAWLEEQQVPAAQLNAAAELGADALLLQLRRAAGGLVGDLDRAYALPDDPARTRLDLEPLLGGADTLRACSAAFALQRHLENQAEGPKWWSSPKAADVLRDFWKTGELPEPVRAYAASAESLLAALGAPAHGGIGTLTP